MQWQELLGPASVGRDSDFFDLGGQSIHAMQLAARMESLYAKKLELRAIYENPTLEAMARIDEGLDAGTETAKPIARADRSAARRKKPEGG